MGSRILIIEDNPANLKLMSYLLKGFGHEPIAAETGELGLEIIKRQPLDMIICDLQLPDIDGCAIARWLKSHPSFSDIPIIAVTAFAMVGDRDRVLATGFDGYLAKPITPETFVRDVEDFLKPSAGLTHKKLAQFSTNSCSKDQLPLDRALSER